jgi:hypothetical protein
MMKVLTDNLGSDVAEIKDGLNRLPEALEKLAMITTDVANVHQLFEKALQEHSEFFTRIRALEAMMATMTEHEEFMELKEKVSSRDWVDQFRKGCVSITITVGGIIIVAMMAWGLAMFAAHIGILPHMGVL